MGLFDSFLPFDEFDNDRYRKLSVVELTHSNEPGVLGLTRELSVPAGPVEL